MKSLVTLGCALALAVSLPAQPVPTPDSTLVFPRHKDARTWEVAFTNSTPEFRVTEWVLKGDTIKHWKELVDHHVFFTPLTVEEFVVRWKAMLAGVDPKAEMSQKANPDGSITVSYNSAVGDEMGVCRYFKSTDGVYSVAYRARPGQKSEPILQTWRAILAEARLDPRFPDRGVEARKPPQ